jgi:hypothetical protein
VNQMRAGFPRKESERLLNGVTHTALRSSCRDTKQEGGYRNGLNRMDYNTVFLLYCRQWRVFMDAKGSQASPINVLRIKLKSQ